MDVRLIDLPKPTQLVEDYLGSSSKIRSYFEYDFNEPSSYKNRLNEVKTRSYKRSELIEVLKAFNTKLNSPKPVIDNIERLASEDAVVVVGGQQAGLLTGPIYTIHKCLAILQFARKQEETLGVPVVPVFWIAGEDHDYAEVNHVHVYADHRIRKAPYRIKGSGQVAVSDLPLNHDELDVWIKDVFKSFGETDYTAELLQTVREKAQKSDTLVSFFAHLIQTLFGKYGLVLMDSGDPALRQLESDYFIQMIEKSGEIAKGVTKQLALLSESGYKVNLDQSFESGNLFLNKEEARILLSRDEHDFVNYEKGVRLSKEELQSIAKEKPFLLSNNVVTRPLMEDLVLPTLAFIGGPGEIAYWSALKPAFETMGIKMPPVVPRLHLTLVDRKSEKWLQSKKIGLTEALSGQVQAAKEAWLLEQHDYQLEAHFDATKKAMHEAYTPYREMALAIHSELDHLSQGNWERIEAQLAYLKKQMDRHLRLRFKTELDHFDAVEALLLPNGGPQERIWSAYYFLNYYGPDLVDRLMEGSYDFNGRQHAVYL
ncbi:MAG TPA: bacillithiol biosynthesis cysteine-adding enzyme BshC [Sporolactobacillaceae bacterium]|nr:bacillithiol biosynthesis cysteine-adding enzyme BshC [Sporolactobacillaceae bacterium]